MVEVQHLCSKVRTQYILYCKPNFTTLWRSLTAVNTPSVGTSCCSDPDQQHNRGHQHFMGDPHPHGGSAEEWDGNPQHDYRRPPPEGLGALHGPEELHHIRRSAKMNGCLFRLLLWVQKSPLFRYLVNQDLTVLKGDYSVLQFGQCVTPEGHLSSISASLVGRKV